MRILIADDQELTATGTAEALGTREGFNLVGPAGTAAAAAQLAATQRPDVALVHVNLPGGGEDAVRAILTAAPETQVLAHSGAFDQELVVAMFRAGASGYVVRDAAPDKLAAAVRGAARGETVFDDVVRVEQRALKRARIRAIIEEDRLRIVFQPIVALESRAVVGYEALARFSAHPDRGPLHWFKEAHEVGLGEDLELRAVRVACERSHGLPAGTFLAVNVSPATAERPELLTLIARAHVDHVVLEVTEHARVDDYARFRVALARVRALGARLAVDDAGAGFASLRHILELNAELIKLDGSLTGSLEFDPRRCALASALTEFARASGAGVVAEHIESERQLAQLRRLGVQYGQGYHLGRPESLPAVAA